MWSCSANNPKLYDLFMFRHCYNLYSTDVWISIWDYLYFYTYSGWIPGNNLTSSLFFLLENRQQLLIVYHEKVKRLHHY